MTRVLITGICGFAGSVIARGLCARREGIAIVGIDNLSRPGSQTNLGPLRDEGIDARVGDIRFPTDLAALPDVDWVIDAAANPSVLAGVDGKSSSRELVDHNLVGTIQLLEFCRERRIPFTLLSTSRVYSIEALRALPLVVADHAFAPPPGLAGPGFSPAGINEDFSTAPPVSLYGMTKLCSEGLALEYGSAFGFPVWINRCGVLAGAGQFGKPDQGIFSFWIHGWTQGRPLRYLGFGGLGHQVRDCLHPDDLVPMLLRQFDHGAPGDVPRLVHASGGPASARSLAQLSRWCREHIGPGAVVPDGGDRLFDLPWVVLDAARAETVWGWRPVTPPEEIFAAIAGHARQHPGWLGLTGA